MTERDPITGVETTGHVWDDNIQEFNNPLPRWWLWTFYATVVFAIVYWIIYPSWPVGNAFIKGVSSISYLKDSGEEVTTHWNTRALLAEEMQTGDSAMVQKAYLSEIAKSSYEDIAKDADKVAFVESYGNGIFGDYCAVCHQTGAGGVIGAYPNLIDDDWLWGGKAHEIETTLKHGRLGFMPAYEETFDDTQLTQVANYVLSMSGEKNDPELAAAGKEIFHGQTGGCHYCHTHEGTGLKSQGAANLTDKIWTIADVRGAESDEERLKRVKQVIHNGVSREMPGWASRLTDTEIKVLTAYLLNKRAGGQ
ncbi:MAG: cytochrome-c oxidase, cbb3-type subunit III [Proteobacteria bacterium]|nr:MAG: cytochrome-c oxidase, cbb3-type subunit III [Pseudomonadota bacterium]